MALTDESATRKDLRSGIGGLQHRHFATIAAILKDMATDQATCFDWADRLRYTNPKFDRDRFLRACGW